jgi:Uncharacterised protein family (UPF0182)
MARAELRTRVVLGQKDLGLIHTSHPAPPQQALANNGLREHPTYTAYSDGYHGSLPQLHGRNYLRNSVKAVVDAYNGSVTFYVFDKRDPIISAYWQMLPGLFKDRSAMPENLHRHIRYPEDLFTVQAEMYGTYHMTDPMTFYNREDRWEVPHELYRDREIEVAPYYVIAQLPTAEKPEFLLMLPLSVAGKNQGSGFPPDDEMNGAAVIPSDDRATRPCLAGIGRNGASWSGCAGSIPGGPPSAMIVLYP